MRDKDAAGERLAREAAEAFSRWQLTAAERESIPPVLEFDQAKRKRKDNRPKPEAPTEEDSPQWAAVRFREWREQHPYADKEQMLDAARALARRGALVGEDNQGKEIEAIAVRPDSDVHFKKRDVKVLADHIVGVPVERIVDGRKRGTYLVKKKTAQSKRLIKQYGLDRELAKGAR